MTNIYARAYTEVIEILSHFSNDEFSKIPIEKIEFYKNNMDTEYNYKINPNIDLSEQNISKEAYAIMVSLFRDYFATDKQKLTLKNLLKQNEMEVEKEKAEKYNVNNIFKEKSNIVQQPQQENFSMVKYKKSIFSRILNKIKSVFCKQKDI